MAQNNDFIVKNGLTVKTTATIQSTLASTGTTTGALVVAGGVGVGGSIYSTNLYTKSTLGPELSPSISTTASWVLGAGYTITNGALTLTAGAAASSAYPAVQPTIVPGATYCVTYTVTAANSQYQSFTIGGVSGTPETVWQTTTGTYVDYITAATSAGIIFSHQTTAESLTVSSFSVKQLTTGTGVHVVDGPLTVRSLTNFTNPVSFGQMAALPTQAYSVPVVISDPGLGNNSIKIYRSSLPSQYLSIGESDYSAHSILAAGNKPLTFTNQAAAFGFNFVVNTSVSALTIDQNGVVVVPSTSSTNSISSGALQVAGGIGVSGGGYFGGTVTATNFVGAFSGTISGSASQVNTIAQTGNASYYPTFVDTNNASSTGETVYTTSSFVINPSTGNVGIGTSSPSMKLDVQGTSTDSRIYSTNAGGKARLFVRGDTANMSYESDGTAQTSILFDNVNGHSAYSYGLGASGYWRLFTAGTERLRIDSVGNVGIGTSSPGTKLVVQGTQGTEGAMGIVSQFISTTTYNASPIACISLGTAYNAGGSVAGMGGIAVGKENATDGNYAGYLALYTRPNGGSTTERMRISSTGVVTISSGIASSNTSTGALVIQGGVGINGALNAITKSFNISHPTKPGMNLRYGSLEGPEFGVYVRGKLKNSNIIELPDYWSKLVDPESITVNLTPIGKHQKIYVKEIKDNTIIIGIDGIFAKDINCFYTVWAERADIDKLEVES